MLQNQNSPFSTPGGVKNHLSSPFSPFCPVFFVMRIFSLWLKEMQQNQVTEQACTSNPHF